MGEEEKIISLSAKQVSAVLIALFTLLAGPPVANILSPDLRADPFTGTEGRELRNDMEQHVASLQRQLDQCQQRQRDHINDYKQHIKWGQEAYTRDQQDMERLKAQIEEIYRRLP